VLTCFPDEDETQVYQVADLGYYYDGVEVGVRVGIVGGVVVELVMGGTWLQLVCCALV
jgi:hypothetical protein